MHFPLDRTTLMKAILQVALSGFAGLVVSPTLASPPEGRPLSGSVRCRLAVFANDPDPAGLNLRSAAQTGSRVVATIVDRDAMLEVTGSSGKWLRVERVRGADGTVQFERAAWAFGPLTGVRANRTLDLLAAPQQTSPVVARMLAEQTGSVQACDAMWVRVRHGKAGGWMAPGAHCGNSVTTCV
jgi:SH3-like domain-containing protein